VRCLRRWYAVALVRYNDLDLAAAATAAAAATVTAAAAAGCVCAWYLPDFNQHWLRIIHLPSAIARHNSLHKQYNMIAMELQKWKTLAGCVPL
jgi:hypothetical protein